MTYAIRAADGEVAGRAEVYQDKGGGFSWRVRALNGEIVAAGESYTRRDDAVEGLTTSVRIMGGALVDAGD